MLNALKEAGLACSFCDPSESPFAPVSWLWPILLVTTAWQRRGPALGPLSDLKPGEIGGAWACLHWRHLQTQPSSPVEPFAAGLGGAFRSAGSQWPC